MADITYVVAGGAVKRLVDQGDGTWAEQVALAGDVADNVATLVIQQQPEVLDELRAIHALLELLIEAQ